MDCFRLRSLSFGGHGRRLRSSQRRQAALLIQFSNSQDKSVIASEAKQSMGQRKEEWIASAFAR
jgi:hypothetical protein